MGVGCGMDLPYALWACHLPSTYICSSTGKLQMCFLNQFFSEFFFLFFYTFWLHCVPCRMLVTWPGIETMPLQWKHRFKVTEPLGKSQEVVFNPFLSHGPLGVSEKLFFFFTLYHYMLICTRAHIYTCNFMEFLELLKTSPKRTWTLDVASSFCSLVLSLKLCHIRVPEVRTDSCKLKYQQEVKESIMAFPSL